MEQKREKRSFLSPNTNLKCTVVDSHIIYMDGANILMGLNDILVDSHTNLDNDAIWWRSAPEFRDTAALFYFVY